MTDAPSKAIAGVTPGWHLLRVVDANTGEVLDRVREADSVAGTLVRTAVDEHGNLRRDGDRFVTEQEQRAILIEWREAEPLAPLVPADAGEREGAD